MSNTCKDCTNRAPGCHAGCERYAEFKRQREERNKLIREAKAPNYDHVSWSPTRRKRVKGYD